MKTLLDYCNLIDLSYANDIWPYLEDEQKKNYFDLEPLFSCVICRKSFNSPAETCADIVIHYMATLEEEVEANPKAKVFAGYYRSIPVRKKLGKIKLTAQLRNNMMAIFCKQEMENGEDAANAI